MLAELLNTIAIFLAGSKSHKGWLVGSVCQYRGVTMVLPGHRQDPAVPILLYPAISLIHLG